MDRYGLFGIDWVGEFKNPMMINKAQIRQTPAILIIGLGQTGLSCARFCVKEGYHVAVLDTRENPPALVTLQDELPEVLISTGNLDRDLIHNADTIILSPGVDPRLPEFEEARRAGIEMIGDIELFARHANAPVVAITGSNGKSTVTTLLSEMASEAGKNTRTGGNLGTPALDLLTEPAPDFYILELSSFQLETVRSLNAFAATILNISPDHMDRYASIEDYQQAKAAIFAGDGVMVLNMDDEKVMAYVQQGRDSIGFSVYQNQNAHFRIIPQGGKQWLAENEQVLVSVDELKIKGTHNLSNALAALALGTVMGLEMPAMLAALRQFEGLPHRCRLVAEADRVRWFNDSKATNVGACIAAIEGLTRTKNIILIAGGVGKEQDFSALTAVMKTYVRYVILLGQDAKLIERIIPADTGISYAANMDEVVEKAASIARPGDDVLLSPACASFDMFTDYAERGEVFERAVKERIK